MTRAGRGLWTQCHTLRQVPGTGTCSRRVGRGDRPLDDLAVRRGGRAGASSTTRATGTRPAPRPSRRLGELEGGDALLYASGMGADDDRPARLRAAGRDDRARRGRVLRHRQCCFATLERWGLRFVEFDQTGAAAGRRHRLGRVAREPGADAARLGRAARAPAASSSATRPSRRPSTCARSTRAPTSSSTRRRSSSPATTTRCSARRSRATPSTTARLREMRTHDGHHRRARRGRAAAARARDARARACAAITATATELARRACARTRRSSASATRASRADLVRRRRPARGRDAHARDHQRDEPRRRELDDGEPPPLGGRPHPGRAAPPLGRARGRRGALGRPRAGARHRLSESRRGDSNPWPTLYKSVALPAELLRRAHCRGERDRNVVGGVGVRRGGLRRVLDDGGWDEMGGGWVCGVRTGEGSLVCE